VKQEKERLEREKEVKAKVAAQGFARRYVGTVVTAAMAELERSSFFFDPLQREIESVFVPWLMTTVESQLGKRDSAKAAVDGDPPSPPPPPSLA
jgi:radial spoke head protein 3